MFFTNLWVDCNCSGYYYYELTTIYTTTGLKIAFNARGVAKMKKENSASWKMVQCGQTHHNIVTLI